MENLEMAPNSGNERAVTGRSYLIGFLILMRGLVLLPFWALRELYWALDTDAAVRANGVEVKGTVLSTDTETRTFTVEGERTTVTEHFVTYQYETPTGQHTAKKKVEGIGGLKKDLKIVVYYRAPTGRPVTEQDSAVDTTPRRFGQARR